MEFIERYKHHFENYISLDCIGDEIISYYNYKIMLKKGFNPLPVFHYGDPEKYLKLYIKHSKYVCLGGLAKIENENVVIDYINELYFKYPNIRFHVLGKSSMRVLNGTNVYSVDSTKWIMEAVNGTPKHITGRTIEAKTQRACWWMRHLRGYERNNIIYKQYSMFETL
jgi:hypothetical protein